LHLTPVGGSNLREFEAKPRNSFYTAGFLSFGDYAAHHLAGMGNHVSIRNHWPCERRRKCVTLLDVIA
jgi:hypothetical protein